MARWEGVNETRVLIAPGIILHTDFIHLVVDVFCCLHFLYNVNLSAEPIFNH